MCVFILYRIEKTIIAHICGRILSVRLNFGRLRKSAEFQEHTVKLKVLRSQKHTYVTEMCRENKTFIYTVIDVLLFVRLLTNLTDIQTHAHTHIHTCIYIVCMRV
jgi:hypothetical protein